MDNNAPHHLIVHADEVDQTGTDIAPLSDDQLFKGIAEELKNERAEKQRRAAHETAAASVYPGIPVRQRTHTRRDSSSSRLPPAPSRPPPPPTPLQQGNDNPMESLGLSQLRRLVHDLSRYGMTTYAFEYDDAQPFVEELAEWFSYMDWERVLLLRSRTVFERNWTSFISEGNSEPSISWTEATDHSRLKFIQNSLADMESENTMVRIDALETLCNIITGTWGYTGGLATPDYPERPEMAKKSTNACPKEVSLQIHWMVKNIKLMAQCNGIERIYNRLTLALSTDCDEDYNARTHEVENQNASIPPAREREMYFLLTCFYVILEVAREQAKLNTEEEKSLKGRLASLQPSLLSFFTKSIAQLRWNEGSNYPFSRVVLILWKSILLMWDGVHMLARAKVALEPDSVSKSGEKPGYPILTASPLDYHHFRQEITSKYPAYDPPPPLIPFEIENYSILPPYPSSSSPVAFSGVNPSGADSNQSIIQQPVHIATPAPSPPPSPMGPGGKLGKRHNYQTSSSFPFMYPPLDGSSNDIGGKGSTDQQDRLVGKKWEGGDVPASVIEAGEIFSSRMKMTRATRQLWEAREKFLKYERGWDYEEEPEDEQESTDEKPRTRKRKHHVETEDIEVQDILDSIENYYDETMPHLQSLVKVLLKQTLAFISDSLHLSEQLSGNNPLSEPNIEDLNTLRSKEISTKAISGILFLMTKWFKRSHVLKFEYLTQLLLDSNYIPLILKLFLHRDVDEAVAQRIDRSHYDFWTFCQTHTQHPPQSAPMSSNYSDAADSEDDAIPPPIMHLRTESSPSAPGSEDFMNKVGQEWSGSPSFLDSVDGNGPLTTYSFRNFFSTINFLRIMQKMTKRKTHRCMLLVQYKSSGILRKGMEVLDPHLRLYTLKLFKSQVPYSGRKWRQSHMRVITSIYLYCRPELRDEWLTGTDVDVNVDEAFPMEQALRGLTHWWHLREYRSSMAVGHDPALSEEKDFFTRELESMGWGLLGEQARNDGLVSDQYVEDMNLDG